MNDQQLLRYSRHILVDEIGVEGQEKLLAARVLIIGAGGLGSPAALYLASAGIGTLSIADGDTVELSNLQRQILHSDARIGESKTQSAQQALAITNPDCIVRALPRLEGQALLDAVAAADVVLDCSDNFATRYALNRACVALKKPLVSGAAIKLTGQLFVVDPRVSSPIIQFDSPVRMVSRIVGNTRDTLILEGKVFADSDPHCCSSITVRFTLRVDEKGNWKLVEKKVLPARK